MSTDSTLPSIQIKIHLLTLLKLYWYKREAQYLLMVPSFEKKKKLKKHSSDTMLYQKLGINLF